METAFCLLLSIPPDTVPFVRWNNDPDGDKNVRVTRWLATPASEIDAFKKSAVANPYTVTESCFGRWRYQRSVRNHLATLGDPPIVIRSERLTNETYCWPMRIRRSTLCSGEFLVSQEHVIHWSVIADASNNEETAVKGQRYFQLSSDAAGRT